jgi:sulfur carrier protein ThiS
MNTVYVKTIGKLAEEASDGSAVTLPQGACLQDLLDTLGIKTEDVMLAFINGNIAQASSLLTPECQVYLSPFICGG